MTMYECQCGSRFLRKRKAALHLRNEHQEVDNLEWKVDDAIANFMEVTE